MSINAIIPDNHFRQRIHITKIEAGLLKKNINLLKLTSNTKNEIIVIFVPMVRC